MSSLAFGWEFAVITVAEYFESFPIACWPLFRAHLADIFWITIWQTEKKNKYETKVTFLVMQNMKRCKIILTVLKHTFDIQAINGTGFIIRTPQITGEFLRSNVRYNTRTAVVDGVLNADKDLGYVTHVPVRAHLAVIIARDREALFTFETEHQEHRVYPGGKL